MPAIGTIFAQKRNRTGHATDRTQPVRTGISLAIAAVAGALRNLERATEKTPETLETIEVLAGIQQTLESLRGQPMQTINAYGLSLALNFRTVRGLLRQAGLESGGLHDALIEAERGIRQAQSSEPVAA